MHARGSAYRFGGDEYAVLLPNADTRPSHFTNQELLAFAESARSLANVPRDLWKNGKLVSNQLRDDREESRSTRELQSRRGVLADAFVSRGPSRHTSSLCGCVQSPAVS